MALEESLTAVLTIPSPTALWQLRGDLLQAGTPPDAPVWGVLDKFHEFLNELHSSMSAHEYSKMATLLDIGAVGGVAIQSLIESNVSLSDLWKRLLVGGIGESLMVLASRQYVKAAEAEMIEVRYNAAWYLYGALWQLSAQTHPTLDNAQRRQLVEQLLAPIHDEAVTGTAKMVLLGRLFQIVLLASFNMR